MWSKGNVATYVDVTGYTVVEGTFGTDGQQVSTLAITGTLNDADSVYTCTVTPKDGTGQSTDVTLNVFGESRKVLKTGFCHCNQSVFESLTNTPLSSQLLLQQTWK